MSTRPIMPRPKRSSTRRSVLGVPKRDGATSAGPRSLLPPGVDTQLRSLERSTKSDREPTTALRETVEAIWQIVEQAASERALDGSRHGASALLARRELLQRGTCTLSAVIRRGVASGAFRPRRASWAIRRLPFAIVAGACAQWVFGLATAPSLRASAAVKGALEVLRPRQALHIDKLSLRVD
jgi:hypothetical protein